MNPAQDALWYVHAKHHHDADHYADADVHGRVAHEGEDADVFW